MFFNGIFNLVCVHVRMNSSKLVNEEVLNMHRAVKLKSKKKNVCF